jgi:prepilin-type N-terminal cleavage/methylation domain-containing protein/prepilin-type processing-associated H-X9-DG protein
MKSSWKSKTRNPESEGRNSQSEMASGFTLIELIVVIAIIAILAGLLLPVLSKTRGKGQSIACLGNLKQIQLGWKSYVDDNDDRLPGNISRIVFPDRVNQPGSWVLGNTQIDTNDSNIRAGVIFDYVRDPRVYRCPADKSTVRDHPALRRTRSYSMHEFYNCDVISGTALDSIDGTPFDKLKYSQIVDPEPSRAWVLIDENELWIRDGIFIIGNPWFAPEAHRPVDWWAAFPSRRHNNGDNLSFADGHVEYHKWLFYRSVTRYDQVETFVVNAQDSADLSWLEAGIPHSP